MYVHVRASVGDACVVYVNCMCFNVIEICGSPSLIYFFYLIYSDPRRATTWHTRAWCSHEANRHSVCEGKNSHSFIHSFIAYTHTYTHISLHRCIGIRVQKKSVCEGKTLIHHAHSLTINEQIYVCTHVYIYVSVPLSILSGGLMYKMNIKKNGYITFKFASLS